MCAHWSRAMVDESIDLENGVNWWHIRHSTWITLFIEKNFAKRFNLTLSFLDIATNYMELYTKFILEVSLIGPSWVFQDLKLIDGVLFCSIVHEFLNENKANYYFMVYTLMDHRNDTIKCPKLGSQTTRLRLVVPLEFWTFYGMISMVYKSLLKTEPLDNAFLEFWLV